MPTSLETLTISRIGHKGDGVAATPAGEIFVSGTLPGEVVRVERDGERGRLLEVVTGSVDRVAPVCRHVGTCGGCALQHVEFDAYRQFKQRLVVDALAERGITAEVASVWTGPSQTRRRAVVAVQHQPHGLVAGFRERLSHRVVDISGCLAVTPAIEAFLTKIPRLLAPFTFGKKGAMVTIIDSRTGLDVAVNEAELKPERRQEVIEKALAAGVARLSLGPDVIVEARAPLIRFGAVDVAIPPGGFLQASEPAEIAMADHVLAGVAGASRIADLFAGCGTFTLRMAGQARVHAVEFDRAALAALDRTWRFARGLKAVTTEVRDLNRRPLMPADLKPYDAVVFDPPRDGAAPQAKELAKSKVPVIVAVSCNPTTLARDVRYLVDAGFRLTRLDVVDQFLWSHHVEAVAVLRRD